MLLGRKSIPNPVIEFAMDGDFEKLSQIHTEGFSRGWSDGELADLAHKSAYYCYVARQDGRRDSPPLAFVLFTNVADEAEIITLATSSKKRRLGLGKKLMKAVIEFLQKNDTASLFLEVEEDNSSAIGLYRSLGFKQIGERKAYYRSDDDRVLAPSSALVMRLELD